VARKRTHVTAEYVRVLETDLEDRFRARNRYYREIDDLRHRLHEIPIPKAFRATTQEIKVPVLEDLFERVSADLAANPPVVNVPTVGLSEQAQRNSSHREKATNAILNQLDTQAAPDRIWRRAVDHVVQYGMGILKLIYRPDAWTNYYQAVKSYDELDADARQEDLKGLKVERVPFTWQAPDPRTFYPLFLDGELVEVLEITERPKLQVARDYGVKLDDKGRLESPLGERYVPGTPASGADRVRFIEHWDREHVTYWADGALLKQIRHRYGRVPYFPFYGITTGSNRPEHAAKSVGDRLLGLVKPLDAALTMRLNWMYLASYPMAAHERPEGGLMPEGEDGQPPEPVQFTPGVIHDLRPGERLLWIPPPDVGPAVVHVADQILQLLEQYGLPPIAKGMGSGDDSGYALNQRISSIKGLYNPILTNAAIALEEMVKFLWWLIKHRVGESVAVWANAEKTNSNMTDRAILELSPADITHYNCTVSITPEMPSNRIAVEQASLMQQQAGAISMRYHREEGLGLSAPEEMELEVALERLKATPEYQSLLMKEVMKRAGLKRMEQEAEADQLQALLGPGEGQPPGLENPGGMPPPLVPEPGLGMPLLPPDQAAAFQGGRPAGQMIQPNTQFAPGGLPGVGEPQVP